MATGRVSLVGAGPGDPGLWTVRALQRVQAADLVLYDALVDASALRQLTSARCFCVGKRAGRASVKQETIHRLMVRAAQRGQQVVRLKGGDPFVFGRGAEEARALALAGIPCEVVPGVTTAVAAAELAGIPVTYRGVASGFLVLSGHAGEAFDEMPEETLRGVLPGSVTLVVMMGLDVRDEVVASLISHGWQGQTPAAIVCGASTPAAWTWTGTLRQLPSAVPPDGVPGVLVIGDVIRVRQADQGTDGVKYGSH
jgi:uroporphyrin-III C-methyltransferase